MFSWLGKIVFEDKGFFLFPTVLFVIVVFVIGMATLELAGTEAKISRHQKLGTEALYLAEAGIQMAIHMLERDPDWQIGYRNYPLGRGMIKEVTIKHQGSIVTIESQGEVQGAGRRIRVQLAKIPVPSIHTVETQDLILRPGANVKLMGEAVHYGNFDLAYGELEGFLTVEGSVQITNSIFKGALAATDEIVVREDAAIEGILVSSKSVRCPENFQEVRQYSHTPVLLPKDFSQVDLSWYYQQPHIPIEESVLYLDEISSGIYAAMEDLSLIGEEADLAYDGSSAIVVPGTLFINCNLVPKDPNSNTLVLAAERIILGPGVTEVWGILLAREGIQIEAGSFTKEIFGTLQAPRISFTPGHTTLVYYPFRGTHLVKKHQTLFQITKWQEIMLMR